MAKNDMGKVDTSLGGGNTAKPAPAPGMPAKVKVGDTRFGESARFSADSSGKTTPKPPRKY
jgi:hypothetical protein